MARSSAADVKAVLTRAQALVDDEDAAGAMDPAMQALEAARAAGDKGSVALAARLAMLAHAARGQVKEAQSVGQKELDDLKKTGSKIGEGVVLLGLAEVTATSSQDSALQKAQEALKLFREQGERRLEGLALVAVSALLLRSPGDKAQAAEQAKQAATDAVPLLQQAQDVRGEAAALHGVAAARMAVGAVEGALRAAREALALLQTAKLQKAEASELHSIAAWLLEEGEDAEEAAQAAAEALGLLEEAFVFADQREIPVLRTLVKAHLRGRNFDKALKVAKDGLDRFQEAGDKRGEGAALELMSLVLSGQGFIDKAIRSAKKAAYTFEDVGDVRGRGTALRSLCQLQCRLNQYDKALRSAQDALAAFEEVDDLPEQASTLQLRAEVFMGKNDLKSAVRCATEARELYQDAKDSRGEAAALLRLAAAELAGNEPGRAARAAEEAQALASAAGDVENEAAAYRVIGDIHMRSEQYDGALKAGQRALALYRELGNSKAEEAAVLMQNSNAATMATVKRDQSGKGTEKSFKDGSEKALKFAKESLSIARKLQDQQLTGLAMHAIAQCHTMTARSQEALKAAEEGLKLLRGCGDMRGEGAMHVLIANVQLLLFRDLGTANAEAEEGVWLCQQCGDKAGEEQAWEMLDKVQAAYAAQRKQEEMAKQMAMAQAGGGPAMQIMSAPQATQEQAPEAMPSMAKKSLDPNLAKLDVSAGLQVEAVNKQIVEVAKALIGEDDDIELDMPLMEAGLTSNTAVLLRDALMNQMPGVNLPVTLTFDYPSVSAMTDLIMENAAKKALQ